MQKRSNVLACLHGAWAPPSHAPLPAQEFFWGAVQRAGGVRCRVIPTSHGGIPPGRGIALPQNAAVCFVPLYKGGSGEGYSFWLKKGGLRLKNLSLGLNF